MVFGWSLSLLASIDCKSACKNDPLTGVIGVQNLPTYGGDRRAKLTHLQPCCLTYFSQGAYEGDVDGGDDQEDSISST